MNATPQTERTPFEGLAAEHDVKIVTLTRKEWEMYECLSDEYQDTIQAAFDAGGPEPRYVVLKVID